ncbi:hypothetical protein GW17_00049244 [Ensete ventricosum]|nr:hypothetical protein GW17_00049244 [Ensete ventricosum]
MLGGDLAEFFHAFGLARVNAGLQHVLQPVISEKKAQIRIAADEEDSSKKESCLIEGVALKKALVPDLLMPPLLTALRLGRRHYSLSLSGFFAGVRRLPSYAGSGWRSCGHIERDTLKLVTVGE